MMHAHIDNKGSAVPWWAAFGAPLLGVPILVALLALGSGEAVTTDADVTPDPGYALEQVDVWAADASVELPPQEKPARSRC